MTAVTENQDGVDGVSSRQEKDSCPPPASTCPSPSKVDATWAATAQPATSRSWFAMTPHDVYPHLPYEDNPMSSARHVGCDDGGEDPSLIYTTRRARSALQLGGAQPAMRCASPHATALPTLFGEGFGSRKPKTPQTAMAAGQLGTGTAEAGGDEPVSGCATLCVRLHTLSQSVLKALHPFVPTTRATPVSEPWVPPNVVTVLLFEASRLLSVVPAAFGVAINAWCLWFPPGYSPVYGSPDHHHISPERTLDGWGRRCLPDRGDYFIAVLWALLTAYQCLQLTTGLLHRWRAYYCPKSTLVRLLALQAICWPATHFTLDILGSLGTNATAANGDLTILECGLLRWATARPDVCWAVIGTTTCVSRSIQIWVTSNLLPPPSSGNVDSTSTTPERLKLKRPASGEEMRKLYERTWDWGIVMRVCMLPSGFLYFVMAWLAAFRREVGGC